MRTLLGHSSLSNGGVIYVDDEGYVCAQHENGTSIRIQEGQAGPASPKILTATQLGILTSNTGAQNFAAYEQWRTNVTTSYVGSHILFDVFGTYQFDDLLLVPAARGLRSTNTQFTILKYTGAADLGAETSFINGTSSEFYLNDLTITVRNGVTVDGLLDYVVASIGSLDPNQAGATVWANNVYAQFGAKACWYGLNSAFQLYRCNTYSGTGLVGYWFDGCSESLLNACFASVWVEAAVRNVGTDAADSPVLNGGKLTIESFVGGTTPPGDYGLDIQGTANCVVTGCTIEGAELAAFYIHDGSNNVHMTGTRSNGGPHVIMDKCTFCSVEGAGVSGFVATGAYITSTARNCQVGLCVETAGGHFYMDQLFGSGTTKWVGQRAYVGDPLISKANTVPTDGYFEINNEVIRTAVSGQPQGWRCTANGQPLSKTATVTFTAVGGTADTIGRAAGSFLDDGIAPGNAYTISGSVSNNVTFTVLTVTATLITLTAASPNLTNEGPVAVTFTGTGVFKALANVP